MRRCAVIALLAVTLLLVGCDTDSPSGGGHLGPGARRALHETKRQCGDAASVDLENADADRCYGTISLYCGYGAVSRAQLDEYRDNVTLDQVKRLDTNAARFAPLDLSECLDDSGPFCESTLRQLRSSERADYYGG